MSQFAMLPLDNLVESTTNPRRTFDAAKLAELADSIRAQGVIQPILVRPQLKGADDEHYEIVAGHRRFRAAQMASVAEIPALIRPLSDLEVLEIQLLENLQRDDLTALDEAEGYRALADQHGMSADAIARKIGKSREYVFARMKLLALGDEGRAALEDGRLSPSVALLVARLPRVVQPDAIARVTAGSEPMSARGAAETIRRSFSRRLKDAPFDIKVVYFGSEHDTTMTPIAPPCGQCEKRTKALEDLFSADNAPDMCLDGDCYDLKRQAEQREVLRRARSAGQKIIEGEKAAKLLKNGRWRIPGFLRAEERTSDYGIDYAPVEKLLDEAGEHAPRATIIIDAEYDNEILKVYDKTALRTALEKAGYFERQKAADPKPGSAGGVNPRREPKEDPKAKAARLAAEEQQAVRMEIFRAVREHMKVEIAAIGGLPWEDTVRQVARIVADHAGYGDGEAVFADCYGLSQFEDTSEAVDKCATLPDLFLLMWTAVVAEYIEFEPGSRENDRLLTTADRLGVDAIAIETRVKMERRAAQEKTEEETPPAAAAAPKKTGKKASKIPPAEAGVVAMKDLHTRDIGAAATGVSGDLGLQGDHA